MVAHTDGLTEVFKTNGELLESRGLAEILAREAKSGYSLLAEQVYQCVLDDCGDVSLPDDVLLLSVIRETQARQRR